MELVKVDHLRERGERLTGSAVEVGAHLLLTESSHVCGVAGYTAAGLVDL